MSLDVTGCIAELAQGRGHREPADCWLAFWGNQRIHHIRVPTGSWREVTPHLIVIVIDIRENEALITGLCVLHVFRIIRYQN